MTVDELLTHAATGQESEAFWSEIPDQFETKTIEKLGLYVCQRLFVLADVARCLDVNRGVRIVVARVMKNDPGRDASWRAWKR